MTLQRRDRIARTATATVAWTHDPRGDRRPWCFAGPLSKLVLTFRDPLLFDCAVVGLWAFTNLEMAYAQLRVDERSRTYIYASGANVLMTVVFTTGLVVFAGQGARGLLLGNFGASAVVVLGLWWVLRRRFSLRVRPADLRAMLSFGLPTVPADASVYALQVADRCYLFRADSHGAAAGCTRSPSSWPRLSSWRCGASSTPGRPWPIRSRTTRRRAGCTRWSRPTTRLRRAWWCAGWPCWGAGWCGCWPNTGYFGAYRALPWLAMGWALYGLYLVFLAIAGRARVTSRNFPAAAVGTGPEHDPADRAGGAGRR